MTAFKIILKLLVLSLVLLPPSFTLKENHCSSGAELGPRFQGSQRLSRLALCTACPHVGQSPLPNKCRHMLRHACVSQACRVGCHTCPKFKFLPIKTAGVSEEELGVISG